MSKLTKYYFMYVNDCGISTRKFDPMKLSPEEIYQITLDFHGDAYFETDGFILEITNGELTNVERASIPSEDDI